MSQPDAPSDVGLAGERGDDGNDLLAVADVAVNLQRDRRIIAFLGQDRTSELEDAKSPYRPVLLRYVAHLHFPDQNHLFEWH